MADVMLGGRAIIEAVVAMASALDLKIVAEGVETAEEADVCMRLGFTHAQGFHLANGLGNHRVHLSWHDRRARLQCRGLQLVDARRGAGA